MKKIRFSLPLLQFILLINYSIAQERNDSIPSLNFNQIINTDRINKIVETDPLQLISGQASGVFLTKKGSDPNAANKAIIRNNPNSQGALFVIDGIVGADPSFLLPDDIESFEILKDATSTAIFGSKGVNGVIIIHTKSYKGDKKLSVYFGSFLSYNTPSKRMDLLSANEYRKVVSDNGISSFIDGGSNTDWQDEIMRKTISQTYNISIMGNLNKTNYRVSLYNQNEPGIVIGSNRKNIGANLNINHKAFNDRLKISTTFLASKPTSNEIPDYSNNDLDRTNIFFQAFTRNPTDPVFESDGKTYDQTLRDFNYSNPLALNKYIKTTKNIDNLNYNINGNYKMSNEFSLNFNFGTTYSKQEYNYEEYPDAYLSAVGLSNNQTSKYKSFNIELGASYNKILKDNHQILVNTFVSSRNVNNDFKSIYEYNSSISTDYEKTYLHQNSIIGQVEYNFKQRYFIKAIANQEFLECKITYENVQLKYPIKRSTIFPSLSIGWKLGNESFIKQLKFIDELTLIGGYGITGSYHNLYLSYSNAVNDKDKLEIEKTDELSFGVNLSLLKKRIVGSVRYYVRNSRNALSFINLPVPPNPYPYTYGNGNWYRNKGFEITLEGSPIDTKNLKWKTSLILYSNRNELVLSESNNNQVLLGAFYYRGNTYYTQLVKKNGQFNVFYLPIFAGYNSSGSPLYYTETGKTSSLALAEKKIVGQTSPKYIIGWGNNFTLNNRINLSINLQYAGGYNIYNATRMYLSEGFIPALNTTNEGVNNFENNRSIPFYSNYYLEDASYLRIEDISLSYTLKLANLKWGESMKVYFSVKNLLTITDYSGFDPAGSSNENIDYFNVYPLSRSFIFGINLTL